MKCPIAGVDLVMTERRGVEIDYCPTCRGVWLDRGELDKIIDRVAEANAGAAISPGPPAGAPEGPGFGQRQGYPDPGHPDRGYQGYGGPGRRDESYRDAGYRDGRRPQRRRKDSFLEDLFDFG